MNCSIAQGEQAILTCVMNEIEYCGAMIVIIDYNFSYSNEIFNIYEKN